MNDESTLCSYILTCIFVIKSCHTYPMVTPAAPLEAGRPPAPRPAPPNALNPVLGSLDLDRSSPVPLYFQVAQHLEHAIETGLVPPGTRLDNEIELAQRLGLS